MNYNIKINEVEKELKKVIALGYGETIEIKINGEYYNLKY